MTEINRSALKGLTIQPVAPACSLHLFFGLRFGGEHEDRDERVSGQRTDRSDHLDSIHLRHVEVGDDQIEFSGAHFSEAIFSIDRIRLNDSFWSRVIGMPVAFSCRRLKQNPKIAPVLARAQVKSILTNLRS